MGMVINNSPPCKDCPNSGCGKHSSCQQYMDWKESDKKKKEALYGEKKRTCMLNDFYVDSCRKQIKRNGGKV